MADQQNVEEADQAERDRQRGAIEIEHRLRGMAAKAGADELFDEGVVGQRLLQLQLVDEALGELVGVFVLQRARALGELGARTFAQFLAPLGHLLQARAELVLGEHGARDRHHRREQAPAPSTAAMVVGSIRVSMNWLTMGRALRT